MMKNNKINYLLCTVFFALLAVITFRCVWPADHIFSASDLNVGRLAFIKNHLPASLTGYFTANQLLGSGSASFSLFKGMLAVLPAEVFGNVFYGAFLVFGSMAMVWFMRLWARSWTASVFGALISFWVNSIMLATGGHIFKIEVLVFSVLSLCLIEKAVRVSCFRRSSGFSILAGICVGVMMIEQQDVALLAGLFVGSYTLFRLVQAHGRQVGRWMTILVPVGVVALLLSGSTVLRSYEHNITKASAVQGEAEDKWNFITQWSLVPEEWPDLIASGWGGWSSNNPEGPYWGKLGQSAEWPETGQGFRNFKLTSNYIGIIPFLMGVFGLWVAVRNRRSEEGQVMLFWSIAAFVGFWLAFGKYSLLYKLFYQLPLLGDIRAPIKLLDNFQICLGIIAAYGLDRLLIDGKESKASKGMWVSSMVLAGLMLVAGLRLLVHSADQKSEFTEMGFAPFAETMVQNMANAWLHAALLALFFAGVVFLVWKGFKWARWAAVALVALLAADSLLLTSHYFRSSDITALKKGNTIIDFIKENQGHERVFFSDPGGIYNQWLASDGPFHGLHLFNVWQMSRMPGDYKEFLGTVGRNQFRLWELASIKYVCAPASVMQQLSQNPALAEQLQPVLRYQVPTAQGMRNDVLLEFKSTIPRFALYSGWKTIPLDEQCRTLASANHNARTTLLLGPDSELGSQPGAGGFQRVEPQVTRQSATVTVSCDNTSVLRFSQYYQSGWKVYVDNEPAELLRVDYLCMGVAVPQGDHVVEFRCNSGTAKAYFALGTLLLSLLVAGGLLRPVRKDDE